VSPSRDDILTILSKIIHPGTGKSITEMGMVSDVGFNDSGIVIFLQVAKPQDPLINSIRKACIRALQEQAGSDVKVTVELIVPESAAPKKQESASLPGVKNIIAVASGKGGVGKSTVAVNLSVAVASKGYKVGLIDADVYGPSVPKMFDVENLRPFVKTVEGREWIVPIEKFGVKMLSVGFFVNPEDALIWRGPMATSALRQLINQGEWGELDFLFLDLPPGTGDVHLTIVQEMAITGAVIVSTPQAVALADAVKGISMFESDKINVPILGLIENMSWFTPAELPENKYYIFGKNGCKQLAEKMNLPLLGQIPIVQGICESGDKGYPSVLDLESIPGKAFNQLAEKFLIQVDLRNSSMEATQRVRMKS
jgi:ATP-binding protein involved in chromosome partitioning